MIIPNVAAKATTQHTILKESNTDTYSLIIDLTSAYPYTKADLTATFTTKYVIVYNTVSDANEKGHFNMKISMRGTVQMEAWFWNDAEHKWVFGQCSSDTNKQIISYNELVLDSETQTSKHLELYKESHKAEGINPFTGETFALEYTIINHSIVKWVNGDLQFDNSWEIVKGNEIPPN